METLHAALAARDNNYLPYLHAFTCRTGLAWHNPTPPEVAPVRRSPS